MLLKRNRDLPDSVQTGQPKVFNRSDHVFKSNQVPKTKDMLNNVCFYQSYVKH